MKQEDNFDLIYGQEEKVYCIGSLRFAISREYSGTKKLEDILSGLVIKKESTGK